MTDRRGDFAEAMSEVALRPTIRPFVSIASSRINKGRSLEAMWMLVEIGIPAPFAWKMIERWPSPEKIKAAAIVMNDQDLNLIESTWFAMNIPRCLLAATDWTGALEASTRAAQVKAAAAAAAESE